ncbi:hypothetical protein PC117_g2905 [Phytophthora cactorum]|uniref:IPT/TIG domain-containing protein n=2 Tax=Phytophthora cactorum TaxID=29920 RepID=A0A8T1EKZ4_9STRA|nr:hypothetical protein PC117_g2905 [Phytophthora cactorum]
MNGVDYTTSRQSVYYYDYIDVLSVFPEQVSTSGGTELNIKLAINSTSICRIEYRVDVLYAHVDTRKYRGWYSNHGPTTGGTLVTISGEALGDTSIMCLFGEVEVHPSIISKREVTCTVPSGRVNGSAVDVRVAIGPSIRSNAVEFTYDLPIEIFNVSIQRLNEDTGSILTVTGSNFLDTTELSCNIGAQRPTAKASFIDSTMVRCPIGKVRLSQVTVGVSNNGYDFTFFEAALKHEVSPYITAVYPISGPLEGGTSVRITVANAGSLRDENMVMFCSFGEKNTRALMVENDTITCISPGVGESSVVPISFYWRSFDLEDRFDAEKQGDIEFYYELFPRLTDISPSSGSAAEGTVLTLSGSEFRDGMVVRFGVGRNARHVPASIVSTSIATVEIPEQLLDGIVSVAVSANEVDFSESLTFLVRPRPVLHSVYPSQVNTQVNITLTIRGTGFTETARETMRCRIGNDGPGSAVLWVSTTQILCLAPYLDAGIYNVYVALNGVNFVNDEVKILYQEQYVVYNISPANGVLGGGTRVQIFGSNFHGDTNVTDLVCTFGTKVSALQVINASLAECITPSQVKVGSVSFSIARLADVSPQYKTLEGLSFHYHKMPTITKILPSMIRATNASTLRLIGANFIDSSLLSCSIDNVPVLARFISSSIIECLLNEVSNGTWLPESTLSVEVTNNGRDVSNSELQILVHAPIQFVQIEPSKGPIRRPLTVKIRGENICSQYQNLKCHVGETQVVAATNLGDGWIECTLPPSPRAGIVQFSISVDGVYYASDSLRFSYEDTPVVYSIYPAIGPFRGGTMVTVQGEGFDFSEELYCVFGTSIVAAQVKTTQTADCVSPAYISGSEQVVSVTVVKTDALTAPTVDTQDSIVTFSYVKLPQVLEASPSVIFTGDRPLVSLQTTGIDSSTSAWCTFGRVLVKAESVDSTVNCRAPGLRTGRYFVEVSTNERDFSDSRVEFTVDTRPVITTISPTYGSPKGGNVVSISGSGFNSSANLECSFAESKVPATLRSADKLECVVPPWKSTNESHRVSAVKIYVNGQNVLDSTLSYAYLEVPVVISVSPAMGPVSGGTNVTLKGQNLVAGPRLVCVFGSQEAKASLVSVTTAWCIAPPQGQPTTMYIRLKAFNPEMPGEDFISDSQAAFEYYPQLEFLAMYPSEGPCTGGTELKLNVSGVRNTPSLSCAFTIEMPSRMEPQRVIVPGQFYSDEYLGCVTVSLQSFLPSSGDKWFLNATAIATVEVSNNGVDFISTARPFIFTPVVDIPSVAPVDLKTLGVVSAKPTKGPIRGGTPVLLTLSTAFPSSFVFCSFGSEVVPGTVKTNKVECVAPKTRTAGTVRLAIGANGVDFEVFAAEFEYFEDASRFLNLTPLNGVLGGGTLLHISGISFDEHSSYSCKVGELVVRAEYSNDTHVGCRTPAVAKPHQVSVRISDNDVDYSEFNLSFAYVEPLFVSSIYPVSGDIEGGQRVNVVGGNFTAGAETITCRFGDAVTKATVLSASTAQCAAPKLLPIKDIQSVKLATKPFITEIQRVTVASSALQPTVQEITTSGDVRVPEIQKFTVSGDVEHEIQSIRVTSQAYSGEIFTVTSSISSLVNEVQTVELRASSFIGGSFRLVLEKQQTSMLTSYATPQEVENSLETLDNIGRVSVTKTTQSSLGSCTWTIEFLDRVGDIPMLEIINVSLGDSGSHDLFIGVSETVKGQGAPLFGSFSLVIDGKSTSRLPYDAAEDEMTEALQAVATSSDVSSVTRTGPFLNNAYEWRLIFAGFPSHVRNIGTDVSGLAQGRGQIAVNLLSSGAKGEQQQISTTLSSGSFKCSLSARVSGDIAVSSTARDVVQAFDSAKFGRVDVTGNAGGPWVVTFVDLEGNLSLLSCGATQTVTELTAGSGRSLTGTFLLQLSGEKTSAMNYDATAAEVAAALKVLSTIDDVTVTNQPGDVNGGGAWLVTFSGSDGDVPMLEAHDIDLQGETPHVTVSKNQRGSRINGQVAFAWNNKLSVNVGIAASAVQVEKALSNMMGIGDTNVHVDISRLSSGFGTVFSATFTKELGNIPQIQLVNQGLTGQGVALKSETLQDGVTPITGNFTLSYGGVRTPPLQWNVSSEDMATAIQLLQSIPYDYGVNVSRFGPNSSGGMTWRVTFPFGMPRPNQLITIDINMLSGSKVGMQVHLLSQETLKLGGTFQISYRGQTTADIDVTTTSVVALQNELQKLPTLTSVSVARSQIGNSIQWEVTFKSLDAAIATPTLLTVDTQKLSGTTPTANVQRIRVGGHSEIQSISIYRSLIAPTVTFNVVWSGIRSTIVGSTAMSASELKAVLATIPGLGAAVVERYPSAVGVGFTWLILLTEGTRNVPIPLTIELIGSSPSDLVVTVTVYTSTLLPLSGTFSLLSGKETCTELTLGDYCTPEKTSTMPYNVDATTMAQKISSLPGLAGTTVSLGRIISNWEYEWIVTFPHAYLDVPLLELNKASVGRSAVYTKTTRLQKGFGIDGVKVAVEVSSNGQDFSSSGNVYHYTPTPDVYSLEPNHGPVQGGTEVVVTGINFQNSSSLRCKFGERVTAAATFLNSTQFTCVSPSGFNEGDVYVEITNHGLFGASIFTSSRKVFTYDAELKIDSVFPSLGPTIGNFSVQITGGPFRKTDVVRCKFAEIVVVANWKSYDEVLCIAPPHSPGVFTLELTRNGQDYTDTLVPFTYYEEQGVRSISPTFGPAYAAGTRIDVDGVKFVNSSLLSCRFGYVVTPGEYVSATKMRCTTPPLPPHSGDLIPASLPEYRNQYVDPNVGSFYLFPDAHYYPQYVTRLVSVEVSNNQQDFSLSGINFLYYQDETLEAIAPTQAFDSDEPLSIFAYGRNFINTTALTCRLGLQAFPATFVTSKLLLCEVAHPMVYDDSRRIADKFHDLTQPRHALFEVSNNGRDFTTSHVVFEFLGACPTGYFCPKQLQGSKGRIPCPRGTYCPGVANSVFTLCPRGTYQPKTAQAACLRCPIGYHCPHTGMHVPRLCPAGYVCDVTGIEEADQPCPEGHYCLEGTATTATTCTPTSSTGLMIASSSAAEKPTTLRRQREKAPLASMQARKSGCWRNETEDYGLQLSARPSRFWMELRQLPLSPGSSFESPTRGRFCLDDSCVKLADAGNLRVEDRFFNYDSTDFALRRPVACPAGSYCHPGTAASDSLMKNFSTAQPCFEAMYCPEGSSSPRGFGECAPGFYCPFGTRIACPAGSYCPQTGHIAPLPCPPGTFNAMTAQANCTSCPVGFICPGYGRIMPALCPSGYVCSKSALASPNSLCPRGFYCLEGTATSDGFRNDTRLRPYPCRPGTYCLKGVVADEVRVGDYRYPQNCTAGFYCELGSYSPKGSGLCPPGFTCPSGTAAPIPTSKGTFAKLEGTVSAAKCSPGYYAPTIESTECVPCPPGTSCEDDGTAVASICPPGSYRGSLAADGLACLACPQGTWSKNWELRGVEECNECAPGTVCPIDGISNPCTVDDLPDVYTPVTANLTFAQCLERGSNYFFGVLLEPWIDEFGRGAHFLPDRDNGRCYENSKPRGSDLYQRFADFHGPLYEISTGTGVPHQGYGSDSQYPPPNMFARGSLAIDLPVSRAYDVARNCTRGFFYKKQWYPGTCEADIFCSASVWSKVLSADELVAQAQPCPEGYVCDASTTADTAFSHLCPAGYVCGAGTTPDLTLDAPRGQLRELCPAGKYCVAGTAESQKQRYKCPAGYFCPTGTANPFFGEIANDALRRRLSSEHSNPFLHVNYTKYVGEGDIRLVSAHDMHCFDGVDEDLVAIFRLRQDPDHTDKKIVVNRAEEQNRLCARDHKWRTVELALRRNDCDCVAQTKVVRRVFQLWKCTTEPSTATPTVYDPKRFGWPEVHNSAIQCVFPGTHGSKPVDLSALVADGGSGVKFQAAWTETTAVRSYTKLRTLIEAKYAAEAVPVDPYVYDLHHAIELIETFGEETPAFAGFVAGSSEESDGDLIRLDACACSQMLKCPNGTTSTAGADDIYDCVKTGDEVLQRISPIPLTSDRLLNGSDFQDLTGVAGQGLGTIALESFEVAVVTINTTQLEGNLTYGAHYQISVYQDCKPCPPQYKCDLSNEPPGCTYPDNNNITATRLYKKCLEKYDGDIFVCNSMPFFCDRRTLPLAEVLRSAADSGSNETTNIAGCCSCERQEMPYYFADTATDRGFADNKHGYMQFSVAALEQTEITIAVELVHGLYVRDFAEGFTEDRFDLTVFTPGRADYSPSTPSTNTFLAVMQQEDMDALMLPLNLPEEYVRVAGTLTYKQQVASTVLINRMSDIFVGDPKLPGMRGYIRNTEQNSIGELSVTANASTNSTDTVVPPTEYFGLYPVTDPLETVLRSDSWWTQELGGTAFLALPYLPYFSSCRGFDSHIFLFKMLETHPDCTFVSYDQTVEVDQYPWRKKLTPNADRCVIEYTAEVAATQNLISSVSSAASTLTSSSDSSASTTTFETFQRGVSLSCLYEENLEGGAEKLRWYEAPAGTTLFYVTREPTAADAFVAEGDATTGTGWGRSDTLQSYLGTDAIIPVKVGRDAGVALAVPQEVYLNLSYYQVTPGQKRLVLASVNFGKLCAVTRSVDLLATLAKKDIYPCTISKATNLLASKEYTLQVSWEPLNWFELMNLFQFTVDVYLGFFTLVAMASMILGFVIWAINRLFTKMKRPPKFRMKLLLKNVATPPPIGVFFAIVPIFVACMLIYTWWHVLASTDPLNSPSAASFEATAGDWLDQISLDKTRVENYKRGRVGLSFVVIGIYLLLLGSRLIIPETLDAKPEDNAYKEMSITTPTDPFSVEADKEEEEEEENEFWDPRAWKRANFLLTTVCFMAPMLVFWEFSYSPSFTNNIYGYLVLFKILRTVMELVLEHFLHEQLLVMPFAVVLSASESMMAMGSADFIGFTMFYFVNLTLVMIEHLYTVPLLRRSRALWPKWRLSLQRRMRKRRRRTREQKAQEDAEWQRVCEKIDSQASGVEAVLEGVAGYSVVFTELFIAPILLAFQAFFSNDTQMPALYGVRQTDLLYYALFSLFIIPSNFVLGALQLNTMELAHGWKLYEYSAYQRHRFATRDTRWPLAHTAADESIHPSCQSLDLLCFSSQLYFLLIIYSAGILLSMLGISICLRASYSFFGDPITLLIIAVVFYLMRGLEISCIRLGDKFKVWKPRKLADGTLDEDLAAKLALGAGRQRELERERLELQALNSERFRHRFLERNRPWVLQHLAELFTPRTLQATDGPAGDSRPNSEYVRDLYHELVNMGEGRRLKGDRSDISSDSEDDLEKMRRAWSNVPVEGASRDLALYWLARARKRRTFAKLVAGIVAASRQSECCVCGKREDGGYTLHVDLAAEDGAKEHDPRALDRLIDEFENELGAQELDADLWKAYFRKHAAFATLCNVCVTARQQAMGNQANKLVAGMRKIRADEFSSDEGSDEDGGEVPFAPIVVARGAIEGRVLTKWLLAARKRLGGAFPRPEAQEEMERYARKLKRTRRRTGKKDHVDSDEEDEDQSRHWRLELNEAARALALRWLWEARDLRDAAARNVAAELREKLQALNDQIVEADDWFFGRELRESGLALRDDGAQLAEEQARVDEDLAQKTRATERDVEAFVEEKRSTNAAEEKAFAELIAKEREDTKARVAARELELLEAYKQKETEFVAAQRQAREAGELVPALVAEHRTYLAKMAEDRRTELESMEEAASTKTQQKEDAFARKLALAEAAVSSRRALAQHRILALRKEARGVVRARESAWQSKARSWIDRASRKVQVKQQEDAEAQLNDKRRRKRVLLAT